MLSFFRYDDVAKDDLRIQDGKLKFDSIQIEAQFNEGKRGHATNTSSVSLKRELHEETKLKHCIPAPVEPITMDSIPNPTGDSKQKLLNTLRKGLNQIFKQVFGSEPFRAFDNSFEPLLTSLDLYFKVKPEDGSKEQKFDLSLSSEGKVELRQVEKEPIIGNWEHSFAHGLSGTPSKAGEKLLREGLDDKDKAKLAGFVEKSIKNTIKSYNEQTNIREACAAA